MSHPFTLEYTQADKINVSGQIAGDIKKPARAQEGERAHESPMMSSQSTTVREDELVTEGCQTDRVEENPDGYMETISEEMNITITDEERLSFFKILRLAIGRRLIAFANEVSISGLSYLVKPSSNKAGSILRKVVWTMLLLFGTGFMVFQIYDRISYYHTYPTIANYRVAYNRSLRFPSVVICSEVLVSKKSLLSMGN